MRPFLAITTACVLLFGFAEAPFAHTHRRDPRHQHATLMPHSHWGMQADQFSAIRGPNPNDDVQPLTWVALANLSVPPLVAVVADSEPILPAPKAYPLSPAPEPQAHDPPGLVSLPPRSPPV